MGIRFDMAKSNALQSRERTALEAFQNAAPAAYAWEVTEEFRMEAFRVHPKAQIGVHRKRLFLFVPADTGVDCFEYATSPTTKTLLEGRMANDADSFIHSKLQRTDGGG